MTFIAKCRMSNAEFRTTNATRTQPRHRSWFDIHHSCLPRSGTGMAMFAIRHSQGFALFGSGYTGLVIARDA